MKHYTFVGTEKVMAFVKALSGGEDKPDYRRLAVLLDNLTPDNLKPTATGVQAWAIGRSKPSADYLPYLAVAIGCKVKDLWRECGA